MGKFALKCLLVGLLLFIIIVVCGAYFSFVPMWNAEAVLIKYEQQLTEDAESMLKACEEKKDDRGCSWGDEIPLPSSFKKLGNITAYSSPRWPGRIKVPILSGFTNAGVYIVTSPTSFTLESINGSVRKITSHGFVYYE